MPTASFAAHVETLAAQAAAQASAAALPGVVPRPWQLPAAYPSGVVPADPAAFAAACDRSDLNDLAVATYAAGSAGNAGRVGVVAAAKLALDHVACHERALHARHASPQRLRAWAAGRRAGHGSLPYGVFGALATTVNDAAAAAVTVPNAQT